MNLGNGKGPKHTGRSIITLIPTTSVSTNFFQKLNYLCPAFHARRHSAAHNRLRTRRHLDQIPLFHRFFSPSLKWPGCEKSSGKTKDKLIAIARKAPSVSIPQIAEILGISTRAVEKQIRHLKQTNRLRRIGPAKSGNRQVVA